MGLRALLALGLTLSGPAAADFDPTTYPAYETCALCHGLFGVSHTAKFPNLAGQKPDYIRAQIQAFLSGARSNDGGQMSAIVTELAPEAIPIVVEWFATQDPPKPYPAPVSSIGADQFAELGCVGCHDNSLNQEAFVPFLSAQHPGYLQKQMTDFVEDRRTSHPVAELHRSLLSQADVQLDEIANYLSSEARP